MNQMMICENAEKCEVNKEFQCDHSIPHNVRESCQRILCCGGRCIHYVEKPEVKKCCETCKHTYERRKEKRKVEVKTRLVFGCDGLVRVYDVPSHPGPSPELANKTVECTGTVEVEG